MAKKVGIKVAVDSKGALKGFSAIGTGGKKALNDVSTTAKRATKNVKAFGSSIFSLKGLLVGLGTGLAVKKLTDFTIAQAELQDNAIKMSRALGVSVESLTAFRRSAELGGASSQVLDNGLRKLTRNILDVQMGLGTAREAFNEMGISVENADGTLRDADAVMLDISDSFEKMENGSRKSAQAQLLFGRAGAQLINTLNGGSEAFRRQREEAERLGLIFSKSSAKDAEVFNDTLLDLKKTAEAGFRELTNKLLPILTPLMEDLTNTIVDGKEGFKDIGKAIGDTFSIIKTLETPFNLFVDAWKFWADALSEDKVEISDVRKELSGLEYDFTIAGNAFKNFRDNKDEFVGRNGIEEYSKTLLKLKENLVRIDIQRRKASDTVKEADASEAKRKKKIADKLEADELRAKDVAENTRIFNKKEAERLKDIADTASLIELKKQDRIKSIIADAREQNYLSSLEGLELANKVVDLEVQHKIEALELIGASEAQLNTLRTELEAKATKDKEENAKKQANVDDALTNAKINNSMAVANASIKFGKEAFGESKILSISEIGMSTARGIMSALGSTPPNPILAGIIGATGAVQAGKVSAMKLADGTEFVSGGGTNRSDSVPAMLSVGERVVDQATNAQLGGISNEELLSAVNGSGGGVTVNITADVITDGNAFAQLVTNAVQEATNKGLEPDFV